jgi:hypothetical protein
MNNFHLRWVPHQSTDDLRQVRVAKYGQLLRALEAMQRSLFHPIIPGNDGWFYIEYQHASQWSASRDEVPQRVDPIIGTAKFILTVLGRQPLPPVRLDTVPVQIQKLHIFVVTSCFSRPDDRPVF